MLFQRREIPWEVVERKTVDPVPICLEDSELELAVVKTAHAKRHYVLEVKSDLSLELRKAIMFAQERFLEEIEENGYNVLLSESWQVSLLRRGNIYRIEVEYSGRPARAVNARARRQPPYIEVLQDMGHDTEISITKKVGSRKTLHRSMTSYNALRSLIKRRVSV